MRIGRRLVKVLMWGLVLCLSISAARSGLRTGT